MDIISDGNYTSTETRHSRFDFIGSIDIWGDNDISTIVGPDWVESMAMDTCNKKDTKQGSSKLPVISTVVRIHCYNKSIAHRHKVKTTIKVWMKQFRI